MLALPCVLIKKLLTPHLQVTDKSATLPSLLHGMFHAVETSEPGGTGSEAWNRVYMIAPVKKFGRVELCTNFIPNKHGGGEKGELAELAGQS